MMETTAQIIKMPKALSGYWFSFEKDAEIDFEKKEITTLIDNEKYTQTFHDLSRFEMFHILKYLLPGYAMFSSDIYHINVVSGTSMIAAAATIIIWQKYRESDMKTIVKVVASITAFIAIVGTMTNLLFLMKLYMAGWIAVFIYETYFGVVIKEWQTVKKVYIPSLPKFFCHYFKPFSDDKQVKKEKQTALKIKKNVNYFAAFLAALGVVILTYSLAVNYISIKKQKTDLTEFQKSEKLISQKKESENNGTAQIIIQFEKVKLSRETEVLQKQLGIKPQFLKIKKITYPWEVGYQHAGTYVFDENGTLKSSVIAGNTK